MLTKPFFIGAIVVSLLMARTAQCSFTTFSVGGDTTTASIQPTVDSFRAALGNPNNANAAGPLASGRREINWDGGGATTAASAPATFAGFQNTRGALFTTPGTGFLQTPLTDPALTSINATYATTFGTFSPQRFFTAVGSGITDVTFSIPGTGGTVPATVHGFGAVFSDVDVANVSLLQFFDEHGTQIFIQSPSAGTVDNASLSFLGAIANAGEEIFRVRITTGSAALGPNDDPSLGVDMVVLDDFIYAEPSALPEIGSTVLYLSLGFAGLTLLRSQLQASKE